MARTKKRKNSFVADDSDGTSPKRAKASKSEEKQSDEPFWELNAAGTRRITINEFRGKTMVNIREYYEKDGEKLPGKKGISLPIEQYTVLIDSMPEIEKALKKSGIDVPRPQYNSVSSTAMEEDLGDKSAKDVDEEDADGESDDKKRNIDVTSDEEE